MRASIFGSIEHSASESWCDVCVVLSSSQRVSAMAVIAPLSEPSLLAWKVD
jgi:hypothetical protein